MSLHAIAYASEARADLQTTDLDRLLADATAFNRVAGVTGVLMFDGSRFLQYLEGPEDGIDSVYQRIANARSHGQLKVLCRAPVAQRHSRAGRWGPGALIQNCWYRSSTPHGRASCLAAVASSACCRPGPAPMANWSRPRSHWVPDPTLAAGHPGR